MTSSKRAGNMKGSPGGSDHGDALMAEASSVTTEDTQNCESSEMKEEALEKKRKRKRKRRRRREGYEKCVYNVLKQVHPGMEISTAAMAILNNLMNDMFERLADEAARLKNYTGQVTLSSREMQGAVKLVLPGELGKHANAEGVKAVIAYLSYDA
ncbi:late histone H2B.L4-like [Neltuma alba]|uniref:late histone H2B.L4-like n=1 Tax=Neltuma alba TaxID=207710 RepID=UPI0010A31137|nr:late histone H2B.L4-like [Prosopis alba]